MAFTGGAPAVVSQVVQIIQGFADKNNGALLTAINTVNSAAQTKTTLKVPTPITFNLPPVFPVPSATAVNSSSTVTAMLGAEFNSLIQTRFPGISSYTMPAESWVQRALTQGGSGIDANVEAQLWARDRARILAETHRASDEAAATWIGRGFSMPPGMLVHQLQTIDREGRDRIGESSRTQAIKSFEAELENIQLAVKQAFDARVAGVNAAIEYMKVMIAGPADEVQRGQLENEKYRALTAALTETFRANVSLADLDLRSGISQHQADVEIAKTEAQLASQQVANMVQAAASAVQAFGQQASAALNGLHAQASISGADQTIQTL